MPNTNTVANTTRLNKGTPGVESPVSILTRALIDKTNTVVLDPDATTYAAAGSPGSFPSLFRIVSASTPVTTDVLTANALGKDEVINAVPAGTIAAMTFTFPTNANSRIGQTLTLTSTQVVTALTVSSSGLTIRGTAVTALAVNTPVTFVKVSSAVWLRTL